MRILLAYTSGADRHDEHAFFVNLMPVGLCSIHSLLRTSGYDVRLANISALSEKELDSLLLDFTPSIIGLSMWTHNRHETIEMAKMFKKRQPGCIVILGGGHATAEAESIIAHQPCVDIIVTGEGEATVSELFRAFSEGRSPASVAGLVLRHNDEILKTSIRPRQEELDSLPYAYRFLDEAMGCDPSIQGQFISTARGCPSSCRFCASPTFWGKRVVARSPESVIEELLFLRNKYGIIYISMRDDTFTLDRGRIMTLCNLLSDKRPGFFWNCQTRVECLDEELLARMKDAGCECVQLGVESGSEKTLDYLGKKLEPERLVNAAELVHSVGLSLSVYIISGVPDESEADREMTRSLLRRMKPHDIQMAPLVFYPGTEICSEYISKKLIDANIFEKSKSRALLVNDNEYPSSPDLLSGLFYDAPVFTEKRLLETEGRYGYSAVGRMQLGDRFIESGKRKKAEDAYLEITLKEPYHPWGWLLLAEMYQEDGRMDDAAGCYEKLLQIVPAHRDAKNFIDGHDKKRGRRK